MEEKPMPQPPAPRLVHTYDKEGRGGWYAGSPEWPGAPVVVFVPGLGQPAGCFWGKNETYGQNDMYALASQAGFRTAFVGFAAAHEKPLDMWHNGRMLAWQVADICDYFRTPAVTLVAHSKGGVDAQTAVVYYGAARYIRAVYTLSSPHGGSQLADIAYSSAGFSLAQRLGFHSDGCFCMQTGYMSQYRAKTDPAGLAVPFYTFAGEGSGPAFSRVWAGGQILSHWGENDGVVTVASAGGNPNAQHLATLDFDHIRMMSGQYVWPHLKETLQAGQPRVRTVHAALLVADAARMSEPWQPGGLVLRGGPMQNGLDESFDVDSTALGLQVTLMAAGEPAPEDGGFSLTAPDGTAVPLRRTGEEGGAQLYAAKVEAPGPGRWKLGAAKGRGDYFASVRFGAQVAQQTQRPAERAVQKLRRMFRVFRTFPDHCQLVYEGEGDENGGLPFEPQEGIYSVEQVLKGELDDGSPFERSVVRQISHCHVKV